MERFDFHYTFTDNDGLATTTIKSMTDDCFTHPDVFTRFEEFMRGCGYVFDRLGELPDDENYGN